MTDLSAREIAEILGGEPVETDEAGWLVLIVRDDGRVVAVSKTSVAEYYDRDAFEIGQCYACISLI